MNNLTLSLVSAILIGLGATLTFDLWALFLKLAFRIPPSNICLVGRWLRTMPEGTFTHANIVSSPQKSAECTVGWIAHYTIGVMFALAFVAVVGKSWLLNPTPLPAILFGVITVLAPFFIMQPAFGFGLAASKMPNPTQARLRSLMNHLAFGMGLYLFGLLVSWFLRLFA
jgi:energy-converting hydrogenase Eha subunit B